MNAGTQRRRGEVMRRPHTGLQKSLQVERLLQVVAEP